MTEEIKKGIKISELLGEVKTVVNVKDGGEHEVRTGKITEVCLSYAEGKDGGVVSEIRWVQVDCYVLLKDDKGTLTILEPVKIDCSDK